MNQSNKKYLEFVKNSGISYYLKESPRYWFNTDIKKTQKSTNVLKDEKLNSINLLIDSIKDHPSPLRDTAKNIVVYDGNINSKIMFIGEAPGKEEDMQGLPFVGRAGQLLNKMLGAINLNRQDVYITNVLNWRPPENRTPSDEEILEFLPFLQKQIDIVNPDYIFLLGGVAAKAILSTPLALNKLRGKWHEYHSLKLNKKINTIASYHPAFLLRSPNFKKASWQDLKMLQKKINDED